MGTLALTLPDGRSGSVQVGDDFASMSDADKNDFIDHVKGQIGGSNSFSGDIQGGLHDLGTSVSQGAHVLGGVMSRNGMPEYGGAVTGAGDWVAQHTPDAPAGPAPGEQLGGAIRNQNYGAIPGLALHAATRALPSTAPLLAAGMLGPVAGPVAAGVAATGLAAGPIAYQRAANNGRDEPTSQDALEALPGAVVEGVGGALVPGGSKIANPVLRATARAASEAGGGAVMSAGGQLGGSVGTDAGAHLDPAQVAADALTQGTIGAGRGARDAVKAGGEKLLGMTSPSPSSPDQAASVVRLNKAADDLRTNVKAENGRSMSDTEVLNTLRTSVQSDLMRYGQALRDEGHIDAATYRSVFMPAFEMAARHNKDLFSSGDPEAPSAWDKIQALGLPEPLQAPLVSGLRDLTNLSVGARQGRQTGPLQTAGKIAGGVTGLLTGMSGGTMAGGIPGAIAGALAGRSTMSYLGGKVGAKADQLFGTAQPTLMRQFDKAQEMAGEDVGPGTLNSLAGATDAARSTPSATAAPVDALPNPDAIGNQGAARNQLSLLTRYGPDHPVGAAAQASLEANGQTALVQQALQQWNQMANVRDAKATVQRSAEQAQADAKAASEESAAQLKRDQQVKKSDAAEAFKTVPNEADLERSRNLTERAADQVSGMAYNLPDTLAARENDIVGAKAITAKRDFGEGTAASGYDENGKPIPVVVQQATARASRKPAQAPEAAPAPTPAAAPQEALQAAPTAPQQGGGLLPMADYLQHVALARYGHTVSPEHLTTGLDALAGKGGLTPDQYEFYKGSLGAPLMNPGGIHTPALEAIAAHAVAAKAGGEAPAVVQQAARRAAAAPDASGVRNPQAYAANLRQEAAVSSSIRTAHPELADGVNQIHATKSRPERVAAMRAYVATLPAAAQDQATAILTPMTAFGLKQ